MNSKAVVFAYHDIGCAGIEALLTAGYDIAAVFTHADDPKENNFYGSVAQLCARNGIPVHAPEDANHPLWIERIAKLNPDYIFSFYYRNLLSEPLLATASKGAFNLHGSLLPKYRGRAPANWVLVNGETETGVTLHRMVKRADAGAILAQQKVIIERTDTGLSLHAKLRDAATNLLRDALPQLAQGKLTETAQDESQATYFGRRTAADGKLDWKKPAEELFNLVRAVTQPYPGAFCAVGEHKLIVWQAEVVKGILQPFTSEVIDKNIPPQYRSSSHEWTGLSLRARTIASLVPQGSAGAFMARLNQHVYQTRPDPAGQVPPVYVDEVDLKLALVGGCTLLDQIAQGRA